MSKNIKVTRIFEENERIKVEIDKPTELVEGHKFFNSSEDDGTIFLSLVGKDGEVFLELDEAANTSAINLVKLLRKKSFYIVGKDGEDDPVKVSLTDKGVANLRESVQKSYGLTDDPMLGNLKRLTEQRNAEAKVEPVKPTERGSLTELMRRRAGME